MAHQIQLVPATPLPMIADALLGEVDFPEQEAEAIAQTCCEQLYELVMLVIYTVCKYIHEFFYGPPPAPTPPPRDLPDDLWMHTLTFLDVEDVLSARSSCRGLNSITVQAWINACAHLNFDQKHRHFKTYEEQDLFSDRIHSSIHTVLACNLNAVQSVRINLKSYQLLLIEEDSRAIAEELSDGILANPHLRKLELQGEDFCLHWEDKLQRARGLQRLHITMGTHVGRDILGLPTIQNLPQLVMLEVVDLRMGWDSHSSGSVREAALIENIGRCAHLRILSLTINWRDSELRALDLKPLLNCTKLRFLRLQSNGLQERHIQPLRGKQFQLEVLPLTIEERKE